MPKLFKRDISGQKLGRLTVVQFVPDDTKHSKWLCRCDCGTERVILMQSMLRGLTRSCGCLFAEVRASGIGKTHGQSGGSKTRRTRTYRSWAAMMDRCIWGGSRIMYAKYGLMGITVCERWHAFESFLADMGERSNGTSLDRYPNGKGNYEPGNCRWATRLEQALNTSRTVRVMVDGKEEKVFELCERLGLSRKALRSRAFRRGRDYAAALRSFGIDAHPMERAA